MQRLTFGGMFATIKIINPRRVCEGYSSHFVCPSVTKLAATYMYLVCESQVQCYKTPYGVLNA